jgi:hypothetical protein
MDETLTLMRLGIDGNLARTLSSTNPIESMIEIVRATQRRETLAGRQHAQTVDRRRDAPGGAAVPTDHRVRRPPKLVIAIERHRLHLDSQNKPRPTIVHQDDAETVTV